MRGLGKKKKRLSGAIDQSGELRWGDTSNIQHTGAVDVGVWRLERGQGPSARRVKHWPVRIIESAASQARGGLVKSGCQTLGVKSSQKQKNNMQQFCLSWLKLQEHRRRNEEWSGTRSSTCTSDCCGVLRRREGTWKLQRICVFKPHKDTYVISDLWASWFVHTVLHAESESTWWVLKLNWNELLLSYTLLPQKHLLEKMCTRDAVYIYGIVFIF